MRKIAFLILLAGGMFCGAASAQTQSDIATKIGTTLAPNTRGAITASTLQSVLTDLNTGKIAPTDPNPAFVNPLSAPSINLTGSGSKGDISDTSVKAPAGTVAVFQSQRAADTMSVRDFGALGYPNNDTNAIQSALAWLGASPARKLTIPMGVWLVDGVSLDACDRCTLDGGAATLLWSGTTKTFSDAATGVIYPQSVLLVRGDQSVNRNGTINIGMIDGRNLGADGLFVSAGYSHTYNIGSIWFTRYGLNYSPHMNYASESVVNVGLIKYTRRGIYEAPDYLYAAQGKPQFMFFSHLTENTRFNVQIIVDCKEYGIKRDAPTISGANQSGSNTTNTFTVGAIDCTDYYDRSAAGDPPNSTPTAGYYKGSTPISNVPAGMPTYPGFTRDPGILAKSPTDFGAFDIRDDYENLTAPTPTTSRSVYTLVYTGNTANRQANPLYGGAGITRSNFQTMSQDFTKFGNVLIDQFQGSLSTNGNPIADNASWFPYTPTVSCQTGTITTLGAVNARYKMQGRTVQLNIKQLITSNGSCAGALLISAPVPALVDTAIAGRDVALGGGLSGLITGNTSTITVQSATGGYPTQSTGAGGVLVNLTYETP